MFTMPLNYLVLPSSLKEAYDTINKESIGLDAMNYEEFSNDLQKNLKQLSKELTNGTYTPEPIKKIEIDKTNSDEKRPIGLSSLKDKIVQRALYNALSPYYEKLFSNKSYAYRPDKSTKKAIGRVEQFLNQKHLVVLKTDIDNFFETINHEKLLEILKQEIQDNSIIRLISLLVQNGGFKKYDYDEHYLGVHQGDILSPLLSNIYLNEMDQFLEQKQIAFVRYADDFVLLCKNKNQAYKTLKELKKFLQTLDLVLEKSKTEIVHINDGFTFLGVRFIGHTKQIENERLQKSISKILKLSKNKNGFKIFIDELNTYLYTLKNYYLKIIQKDSTQHKILQDALIETLAHKIYLSKASKAVKNKREFRAFLDQVHFEFLFEINIKEYKELAIAKGYEYYISQKSYKETPLKIEKKRNQYAKKFANDATLHVTQKGVWIGISKNRITVKQYAKVQNSYPLDKIKRIILEGKAISLSSNLIQKCADNNISIDFINRDAYPYASLITYKASLTQTIHKQAMILNTPKQLEIAKKIIYAKAKNQCNYLKYLNRYHKILDSQIENIELKIVKIKTASCIEMLMGYEGSISVLYWEGVRLVLDVAFEKRVTYGAKDLVNSSLNYGYAILYGKVQEVLVYAGLSLNISFLHTLDNQKPTLTFDMIEEFRTFVVDRTIFAMLNKDEPIKLGNDGLLTKKSRQLIAKNIKEKLGSYTTHKKLSKKIENIIQEQAYKLADVVNEKTAKYKPFIGKY